MVGIKILPIALKLEPVGIGLVGPVGVMDVQSVISAAQRGACLLAYIPKATIQAAFAAVPLDRGLADGNLLLAVAVLAVVVTAPLGVVALQQGVDDLLDRGDRSV